MSHSPLGAKTSRASEVRIVGRYALFDELAAGGMATVHLGRLLENPGRTVAIKRLHSQYANDLEFVTMFMDEARIVARIVHPNVVAMVDVVESKGLFLVMEYVHGETLSKLLRISRAENIPVPAPVILAILHDTLLGLHAAHETKGGNGEVINVVHRDVSPQNVIVGTDGVARVLDFGIAKAAGRAQVTREGQIKGKLAYMAPEQIRGNVDRRADVFAAAVVLWEAVVGRRLHEGCKDVDIVSRVILGEFDRPSRYITIDPALEAIIMKGLAPDPVNRYASARDMALDIEQQVGTGSKGEVAAWLNLLSGPSLEERARRVGWIERASAKIMAGEAMPEPPDDFALRTPHGRVPSQSEIAARAPETPTVVADDSGVQQWSIRTGSGRAPNAAHGAQGPGYGSGHHPAGTADGHRTPYAPLHAERHGTFDSTTGTPSPTAFRAIADAQRTRELPVAGLLGFFLFLALVGTALGAYRFVHDGRVGRSNATMPSAEPTSSSRPPPEATTVPDGATPPVSADAAVPAPSVPPAPPTGVPNAP